MRKAIFAVILVALLLLLCACGSKETSYAAEHDHVWGFWYNTETEGEQVRYCKICMAEQTQQIPE